MKSKSNRPNIKIKSNLYIRGTADGSFSFADEDYIAQIESFDALMKLRTRADASGAKLKLSEKQLEIVNGVGSAAGDMPSIGSVHHEESLLPESVSTREIGDETASSQDEPVQPEGLIIPETISMIITGDQAEMPVITPIHSEMPSVMPHHDTTEIPLVMPDPSTVNTIPADKILAVSLDEIPEPTVEKIPEFVVENVPEPVVVNIPEPVVENSTEPVVEKIPEPVAADIPELIVENVPEPVAADIPELIVENVPEPAAEKLNIGLDGFSEISDTEAEEKISKSGSNSRIILDSVCYSEKIGLALEKIAFIAENHPDKRVLILCGTETAAEKLSRFGGNFKASALDTFAAKYMFELGEPAAKITSLTREEKIALFAEKMRTEDFTNYDFCIIAELDELVFRDIKALLKILVLLECGFLMLTDRRRSVLEYSPESGYEKNFAKLCDVLPENTEKLTITNTKHRLSAEINDLLALSIAGKPADNAKKELISKMRSTDLSKLSHTDGKTAVLCKNSGYAKYVSLMLRKNGISHTLLNEEAPTPVRQLADILWDTHEKVIARDNFIKRFVTRCGSDETHADEIFRMLCGLIKRDPSEGLELARLAEVIKLGGIPMNLVNANDSDLAVAKTNTANGLIFNTVFILADNEIINSDPGKQLCLAAAGRTIPPALLWMDDLPELISNSDNRYVYMEGNSKPSFSLGSNDVDYCSFIGGSMGDAVRKQAYISKNVHPGDSLTLVLNGEAYDIMHGSTVIGKMSEAFSKSLTAEYGGKRYLESLPEKIEGAYAANIFTVVSCCDPSEYEGLISPQFIEHRFWYGVEISGFGC